jgi:hypothetical protein
MKHVNEAAERLGRTALPELDDEEEFVLELRALDERRVEGFVHHRKSGQREAVTDWGDVTEIISRFLGSEDATVRRDGS